MLFFVLLPSLPEFERVRYRSRLKGEMRRPGAARSLSMRDVSSLVRAGVRRVSQYEVVSYALLDYMIQQIEVKSVDALSAKSCFFHAC